jgi:hypothetical protein
LENFLFSWGRYFFFCGKIFIFWENFIDLGEFLMAKFFYFGEIFPFFGKFFVGKFFIFYENFYFFGRIFNGKFFFYFWERFLKYMPFKLYITLHFYLSRPPLKAKTFSPMIT